MKIGYLGMGHWGFCLASILAAKGYTVWGWSKDQQHVDRLNATRAHPGFLGHLAMGAMKFSTQLEEVLQNADMIVEAVTTPALRQVFEKMKQLNIPRCPIVITSKGIEQNSNLSMPDVALEVLGEEYRSSISLLSGPGFAEEVIRNQPTCLVVSSYHPQTMAFVADVFRTRSIRTFHNEDMRGVAFGGGLKNIVAIACGISDGLFLGVGAKASLITRGLREISLLALHNGAKLETLYGFSGMGDLYLTCSSQLSRNFRFGFLLGQGFTVEEAKAQIKSTIEGYYTCVSANALQTKMKSSLPILETVFNILFNHLHPIEGAQILLEGTEKTEIAFL